MFKTVLIIIFFICDLAFSQELISRTKVIMGTYITVKLPEENKDLFRPVFNIFKNIDQKLSIYKDSSEVSLLNRLKELTVSEETAEIIKEAVEISEETDGYFDITVGKITKDLYGFGTEKEKIPKENDIKKYLKTVSYRNIKIKGKHIKLLKNSKIDLGGIGKGYAVDKAAEFLIKKGIKKGIILASGDIRCLNRCKIYIKDPFENGFLGCFETKRENTAVSTSGNYERYIKSKDFNHLINPKTGKPQKKVASVTLINIGDNSLLDAYATAVSVMPLEKAVKFLDKKNIGYVFILENGKLILSKNIKQFVKNLIFFKSDIHSIKKNKNSCKD
ncbi:FAD:protein FMN transferase [Persephonella sp.]